MAQRARRLLCLVLVTVGAMAVLGYHPGVEDDATYLATIKHDLNPQLYPHDLPFVAVQLQLTLFDKAVAASVRASHLSLATVCLLWQFSALLVLFWACWHIAARCYREASARWGGVCFVAVMLAMPVAQTDLFLADQHLHPRLLATDGILLATLAILRGRGMLAIPLLLLAALMHPLMAAFGVSFCAFLAAEKRWPGWWQRKNAIARAGVLPTSWLWEKPTAAWERATHPRVVLFLYRWPWYAWGAILGPMGLAAWLRRIGQKHSEPDLVLIGSTCLVYGVFQLAVAMLLLLPEAPPWFLQFEPMRFLHLVYLFTALLGAGAFARFWLRGHVARWMLVFLPLIACMYVDQSREFAGSPHIEWPGEAPSNPWMQAFAWVRTHTQTSDYFALDPDYTEAPLEGVHSFRALAERSMLADKIKDLGIVTHIPLLTARWTRETQATRGWQQFRRADFVRLRSEFGVNWALVQHPVAGLDCPWHNGMVWVCRIPAP